MLYKKEFKLQQLTPIIHFQHYQDNPTLRATEVKPKLDRFVHVWMEKKGLQIPEEWYLEKDKHYALNYKMRIEATGTPIKSTTIEDDIERIKAGKRPGSTKITQSYFANMVSGTGDERINNIRKTYKETVFYNEPIDLTVISFCKKTVNSFGLLDVLIETIPLFFMINNFGTRQSKGFGSFVIADLPNLHEKISEIYPAYYYIEYKNQEDYNTKLGDIWIMSNLMKSGFNYTFKYKTDYYKGRIFKFMHKKGIGNDKAFIKKKVLPPCNNVHTDCKSKTDCEKKQDIPNQKFVRALLGLPGFFEYKDRKTRVDVTHDKIKRFKSPVLFKVDKDRVYILPQEIDEKMFGEEFKFNGKKISTPDSSEFNLIEFLDYFSESFNKREDLKSFKSSQITRLTNGNKTIKKEVK
ncbi:UNVERIFIED_CONTAM: hypothetical protein Cloal_2830 [Acetivibrio alkalicellulosi]